MRTLVVTNDFPPRPGGIQTYVYEMARRQPPGSVVVLTSSWRGAGSFDAEQSFPVVRMPTKVLLPTVGVARRAAEVARLEGCSSVWFGALAPLGLLAPGLRRAGVEVMVGTTHGHEVGWALTPGGRQLLRRAGTAQDVVTVLGAWTRQRLEPVLRGTRIERLPGGVDPDVFAPDARGRAEVRARLGIGADQPVVVCVSRLMPRKGQDTLVRVLPALRRRVPGTVLLLVGGGPSRDRLSRLAGECGVSDAVAMTGSVPWAELPAHYAAGDVFAMPCRTRLGGLDVEGLGLVFLEASGVGLPVVGGRSGGAPDALVEGVTGHTVDSPEELVDTLTDLLLDRERAARLGAAGRDWVRREWHWDGLAARLAGMLRA
jgi:phosphatidylinositol alpha-1,6-mannosyltransferase